MSKKANPTTVGAFVVGAVALAVAGIITFSKSQFFVTETRAVCYFSTSLVGLDVGAPVRFQGIQVGTVHGMEGVIDPDSLEVDVPVYIDITRGSMSFTRERTRAEEKEDEAVLMQRLVDKGLRAELLKDSLVTGKLYVALEFEPDTPARLVGHSEFPEIPTIEAGFAKLAKNIEEIDFEGLVTSSTEAVKAIEELVTNPEIAELIHNLNELTKNLNEQVDPLSQSAQTLMADADKLVNDSNREVVELSDTTQGFIRGLDGDREVLVGEATDVLKGFNSLDADYALSNRAIEMLDEIAGAARSIRILAEYLERHPEALLKGKN